MAFVDLLDQWEQFLTQHLLLVLGREGGQDLDTEFVDSFIGLGLILSDLVPQFFDLLLGTNPDLVYLGLEIADFGLQVFFQGGREGRWEGGRVGLLD